MRGNVIFTWSRCHFKCNRGSLSKKGGWLLGKQLGVPAIVTRLGIESHGQMCVDLESGLISARDFAYLANFPGVK